MKERPILFSGPMVRAILEGHKTQTRRVVKNTGLYAIDASVHGEEAAGRELLALASRCPYGQPGERLWVREAHAIFQAHGQHRKDGERWGPWGGLPTAISPDLSLIAYYREGFDRCGPGRWRPSIHMPRWASRITLEVTGVRVERLQDISEADAVAEGCHPAQFLRGDDDMAVNSAMRCLERARGQIRIDFPVARYVVLWESINGPGSWGANPWVWVIEFRKVAPC